MGERASTQLNGNAKKSFWGKVWKVGFEILNITKKTLFWIVLSYLIPIINIVIILGVKKGQGVYWLGIVNIILATNACFIIGAMNYIYNSLKDRETANFLAFIGLAICIAAFGISTFEIEMKISGGIPQIFYNTSAILSFIICLILAYVSQKEEIVKKNYIQSIIQKGKSADQTEINGQNFKL
ncbi:hypothetical protein [Clostridium tagluense]|uniref:hypothetical protein n=1 Tax=Clostridium tagluense TaxID=360422 RepID=UPI001C6E42B9|nr:hypothetical protein [Clostridium tagluense]MBW9155513.1 hypothetical protein [Clostridium tagluense]WLC66141.1 hypothetical protein KTC93_02550 [Clostridium tagluense]